MDALAKLAASADPDDARTAATLLAAHGGDDPRARAAARTLLAHRDASVRAQAAWALGTIGDASAIASARGAPRRRRRRGHRRRRSDRPDRRPRATSRALAAGSLRRPRRRAPLRSRAARSPGSRSRTPRCGDGATERRALSEDPNEAVRAAAALALGRTPLGDADARALARCAAEDRSGSVAARCRATAAPTNGARATKRVHAVTVYVVPDLATAPVANAPYVLVLDGGALHAGTSDRRGAVFDPGRPGGGAHAPPHSTRSDHRGGAPARMARRPAIGC